MRAKWLLILCVVAAPLSQASATPLPAATYSTTLNNTTPITTPGSFSLGGASGSIVSLPASLAHAHVNGSGTSVVEFQYWFRVDGPVLNAAVPIVIAGQVQISAGNAVFRQNMIWGVTAQMTAQSLDGPLGPGVGEVDSDADSVDCSPISVGPTPTPPPIPSCAATSQSKAVVLTLNTLTGADNRLTLVVAANNQEAFAANFDALVDPVISFAPGFDATGYSITLSDGVGNNAVPEPSAALLMAPALGLLFGRRRTRPTQSSRRGQSA